MDGICVIYRGEISSYTLLVEAWGKELLDRPRGRWRDGDKMEICWGVDWIDLALNRDKWSADLREVMNFLFPYNAWNLLISWETICFPRRSLLACDSTLSIHNKLTLYKLCIRPILTYAAPVWGNTSSYNYRRLQISQSKCIRVIGNFPRRTPIPRLYTTLNVTPIRDFIYHLTANISTDALPTPTPSIVP